MTGAVEKADIAVVREEATREPNVLRLPKLWLSEVVPH